MGYPDALKIPVSDTQAYRQFGNSVVVPVVERIAMAVTEALKHDANHTPDLVLAEARGTYAPHPQKKPKRKTGR